ncbi:hypothetical protein AMELA_G00186430 [Ameiurus melas]|uniref:Uncharacterized protein n=1 Tax=Ameiurus melas TaxID=219545 RepID=A0A7J6AAI1_AMEME|nr:hypothetical protein AMELA_G00186430 [Ameiurus melas]
MRTPTTKCSVRSAGEKFAFGFAGRSHTVQLFFIRTSSTLKHRLAEKLGVTPEGFWVFTADIQISSYMDSLTDGLLIGLICKSQPIRSVYMCICVLALINNT